MIPKVAQRGTSFKGAAAYYLHDKKLDGETSRTTSNRVEWTSTRNMMTDDPERALRFMAATAMDKDRLKLGAGGSAGGRKSVGDVYAYSLAWHPDEKGKFNKAEMLQAADQSIKALGAQDHQAVIVAHNDEKHPHIHVIVNMVNPNHGKNLPLSNDYRKLEKWAHSYRKERKEELLYVPSRDKKEKAKKATARGEKVDFVAGKKNIPNHLAKEFKAAKAVSTDAELRQFEREQKKAFAADTISAVINNKTVKMNLSQYGKHMSATHGQQWQMLSANYKLEKSKIMHGHRADKKRDKEETLKQFSNERSALETKQRAEWQAFYRSEKHMIGKLENAVVAAREVASKGGDGKGFLKELFKHLSNQKHRKNALGMKHKAEHRELNAEQSKQLRNNAAALDKTNHSRLRNANEGFTRRRSMLIDAQRIDKEGLQEKWRIRNQHRKDAIKTLKRTGRINIEKREHLDQSEIVHAKEAHKRAKEEKPKRRTGRTRSRKRD